MRDWSDNSLDQRVESALRSIRLTPQQKRRAWERLYTQAAVQTMLPPVVAAPVTAKPAPEQALRFCVTITLRVVDGCLSLLFDDTRYDRALRQRSLLATMHIGPLHSRLGSVVT